MSTRNKPANGTANGSSRLTPKQRRFVELYCGDCQWNGSAAYRGAGYRCRHDNVAGVCAFALLRNPKVAAEIQAVIDARQKKSEITAGWVLSRLQAEAEDRGPDSSSGARIKAVELLGRFLGMFPDRRQVELNSAVNITTRREVSLSELGLDPILDCRNFWPICEPDGSLKSSFGVWTVSGARRRDLQPDGSATT